MQLRGNKSSSEINRLEALTWNLDLTVEQVLSTATPPMQFIRDCRGGAKMSGTNTFISSRWGMAALRHTADLHPTAAAFGRNFPRMLCLSTAAVTCLELSKQVAQVVDNSPAAARP